jgi:diguanylate cyclase (GGDEF)-like protein/PAS domain S-box-containing protein
MSRQWIAAGTIVLTVVFAFAFAWALGAMRARARSRAERDQLDAALQASEAVSAALSEEALFLSAVLSAVDAAIVLFDRGGRIRFVNDRFAAFFGVPTVEVIGRNMEALRARIGPCFADADAFHRLAELEERRRVSDGQPARASGALVADEEELAIVAPKPRVLLWSTRPVVQGDRRVGVLSMFRDVTEEREHVTARERLVRELAAQARTDALTDLANRRAAKEALVAEVERSRRYGRPLSIAIFDLDHFKEVNDRHGHEVGDKILVAFAEVLRATARGTDVVARWGGEEFLAIVFEAEAEAARAFAERVRAELRDRAPLSAIRGDSRVLTVSAGVATLSPDDDADSLLRRADRALYDAKEGGRDRTACAA